MEFAPPERLKRGEIVVFHKGESFVTHRLVSFGPDGCLTKGDALLRCDPPITQVDIAGRAIAFDHKGKVTQRNGWRWHVLRAYSLNPDAQAARWFCAVESPFLSPGEMEYGDTYIAEIKGLITHRDPVVPDEVLPRHLRGW